jgi:hypothetical protein
VARARLEGSDLHVTVDFDEAAPPAGTPTLVLLSGDARREPVRLPMTWEDDERVGAHWGVPSSGTWFPVVTLEGRLYRVAPVTLPWAPELEPAVGQVGRDWLKAVAKAGGGVERLAMAGLFREALKSEAGVPLAGWLVAACVVLLTAEVIARRFFAAFRWKWRVASGPAMREPEQVTARQAGAPTASAPPAEEPSPSAPASAVPSALAAARERARRRIGRPKGTP